LRYRTAAILLFWVGALFHPAVLKGGETGTVAVVATQRLNIHSAPDLQAPVVMVLPRHTRVAVIRQDSDWLQISHQGQIGYVRNRERYVKIVSTGRQAPEPEAGVDKRDALESASRKIKGQLEQHNLKVAAFTQEEAALVESLNDTDQALAGARRQVVAEQAEIRNLEARLKDTAASAEILTAKINQAEDYVAKRLVVLYKLDQLGRFSLLASAENMVELFQRKFALERILAYDERLRQALNSDRLDLEKAQHQLDEQRKAKLALEAEYRRQIELAAEKKQQRTELLTEIRNRKSLELAAVEALKNSALELDHKLELLSRTDQEAKPAGKQATQNFGKLKGLLKMPVKGTIANNFGSYFNIRSNVMNFRSGIDIRTDRGEPVRAPSAGRVIFASWFKGYGNMLVVDHGDGYYTVYAHLEEFFKTKGDRVEAAEVIATAGDTGSMMGPDLYFEVRHHGKPLDPLEWIDRG